MTLTAPPRGATGGVCVGIALPAIRLCVRFLVDLRHRRLKVASPYSRPTVGLFVDTGDTYGRAVVRGVTRYANVQRRWLLSKMRRLGERGEWPDFDGAICAGVEADIFERVRQHCPRVVFCSGGGDPELSAVVALDDLKTGTLAAEHLLNCRLQHFAFYGSLPSYGAVVNRLEGFREALAAKGHTCVACPVPRPSAEEWATHAHRPQLI